MLAKVYSAAHEGLKCSPVTVEVDIASQGLPSFTIVGLADRAVEEAKERVRSAIKNSGADFPPKRITVNLAPADLPKEGPIYDLAIALGILAGGGQLKESLEEYLIAGELSLDGSLRYTRGILSLALFAKTNKRKKLIVPLDNAKEAAVVDGIEVFGFENLTDVFLFLSKQKEFLATPKIKTGLKVDTVYDYDFSSIKGQEQAKRALEIAAAGGHNVLLKGPPGSGKTLLARSFPSILPPLSLDEALEVTQIYSLFGDLPKDNPLITKRPFRSPHHTASYVGIIGGGSRIKPGEITLSHRGTLFLDEFAEFPRQVLEALRQPLEDKRVVVSRAGGSVSFPAQFILIAAQNPCPCGFLNTPKICSCLPGQISRYQKKISGPIVDRIDMHIDVPSVEVEKLTKQDLSEASNKIRERVTKARQVQFKRFKDLGILTNSEMNNPQIKLFCQLNSEALNLLKIAISQMNLSARSFHRVLKTSRTIADLEGSEEIKTEHIAESLQYRFRDES